MAYQRVLVVEDEPLLRGIIVRNLAARGCAARGAASAAEALAAVRVERPDLLLLDIDLPDRTGWEVLLLRGLAGVRGLLRPIEAARRGVRPRQRGMVMELEYLVGGLVSLALLVYLTYALLYPDRF